MRLVRCWGPLGRGPIMRLPKGKISEGGPDEAGEVLGALVERGPTMRLPQREN